MAIHGGQVECCTAILYMYKEMFTQLWVVCEYYHTIGEREKVANDGKAGGNGAGGGEKVREGQRMKRRQGVKTGE